MTNKDEIAVSVKHLHKNFRLPHEQHSGIKQLLVNRLKGIKGFETQEVLKNISFEIKRGEFFGIVGRNGSGKSTLLKLLAGIYTPDKGNVIVKGSLTPFIELGVGFNPELTGRENVYLNGALLGFSRKEIENMYDDIVEFAELERFMDQKLKNYSSGMQVRLAFSIAIRAKSDILILDEVLAVGDAAFQAKCFDYFEELKRDKKTVILVTHDMSAVQRFCSRALFINDNKIVKIGSPASIAKEYNRINNNSISHNIVEKNEHKTKQTDIKLLNKSPIVRYNEELELKLDWSKLEDVQNVGIAIYKNSGEYIFGTNTIIENIEIGNSKSLNYKITARLSSGNYNFQIGYFGKTDSEVILFAEGPSFVVDDDSIQWGGITEINHDWTINNDK